MTIRVYTEADRDAWDRYVRENAGASCYHLTGWKDVIEESFGHRTCYLLSLGGDGEIDGILPLVHLNSFLFGSFVVSLPFFNYGGVCADDRRVRERLFNEAARMMRSMEISHMELMHTSCPGCRSRRQRSP